jgi:trk/ktr system potassium uptake protein
LLSDIRKAATEWLQRTLDAMTPVQFLASCFVTAIVIGTGLLLLPFATAPGKSIGFIDALFTSTSAVCVTGLIVADTGAQFSGFGQGVILALIQFGGLGIMTASTFMLLALGQRASMRNLMLIREEYSVSGHASGRQLFMAVLGFTFVAEAIGAIVLWQRFQAGPTMGHDPVWSGIFHSVSSFCNAGFSLYGDSFTQYRGDTTINLTVPFLIIIGGIGFPALIDLATKIRRSIQGVHVKLSLHAKIVFTATGVLLVLGMIAFFMLELNNPELKGAPVSERVAASWFQSVTTRTAGFNTIDFGQASEPTLLLTIMMMIVGASPGSTGGGIKTTTLVVIILVVIARLRGHERIEIGGRTIPMVVITKALVVAVLGVALILTATLLLLVTDGAAMQQRAAADGWRHGVFVTTLFEVVSAFGTVGLSMMSSAATGALTWGGKLIIIVVMYLGRLGPLLLAQMVLAADKPMRYRYPEEYLLVG